MAAVAKRAPIQPIDPAHPQPRHVARAVELLDGGVTLNEQSTVLDLTGPVPTVLREGKGTLEGVLP